MPHEDHLPPAVELSAAEARRMAVAAQGFGGARTAGGPRSVDRLVDRLGAIQIDSVNAVARSHYLPLFSRLGPYQRTHLDDAVGRRRTAFEYWGHEASFLPVALWPAMRWRMDHFRGRTVDRIDDPSSDGRMARLYRERPEYVHAVLDEIRARGPLAAGDLSEPGNGRGPWWGWSDGKLAVELLFAIGEVTVAGRRGFTRLYDLPERVLPAEVHAAPALSREDAQRLLVERSAAALGVATVGDLADYYRLRVDEARARVAELREAGVLLTARVEDWREPAVVHRDARLPARSTAQVLLSPFDSLVWDRARTERIFGFRYRLEIYTPAPKRVYGYYVLPLMVGGRIVARLDVRADRRAGVLDVPGAFAEPDCATPAIAAAARVQLGRLSAWLGLSAVRIGTRGDLADLVRRAAESG